jgi:hypothetical protein
MMFFENVFDSSEPDETKVKTLISVPENRHW